MDAESEPTASTRRQENPERKCCLCYLTEPLPPNVKLLTAKCGHMTCSQCLHDQLTKANATNSFKCVLCGTELRESDFSEKTAQDAHMERCLLLRKDIRQQFNKMRRDFESDMAYEDYMEMVEEIIFNKIYHQEIEETERKIEKNKALNSKMMRENRLRQEEERIAQRDKERQKQEEQSKKREQWFIEEQQRQRALQAEKDDRLADIAKGKKPSKRRRMITDPLLETSSSDAAIATLRQPAVPAFLPPRAATITYVLKIRRARKDREVAGWSRQRLDLHKQACGWQRRRQCDREHSELLGVFTQCPQFQHLAACGDKTVAVVAS